MSAPRIGTGATRPVDDPARSKTLPSPHGPRQVLRRCPVHRAERLPVGLQVQDKRSTNHSIERCLGRSSEQVVRASSSSQSGAAPSPDGRLRVPSDACEEAGVERQAQREGGCVRPPATQSLVAQGKPVGVCGHVEPEITALGGVRGHHSYGRTCSTVRKLSLVPFAPAATQIRKKCPRRWLPNRRRQKEKRP